MPSFEFHHVHLYSPDPMKTAEFYEKFFGATRRRPDREVSEGSYALQLELNGTGIYIRSQREGATIPSDPVRGLEHFGPDDVRCRGFKGRPRLWKSKGVSIHSLCARAGQRPH